jgi:NAD(P)-dependent dehydrogenase (short-subunit alcohol dehydrogenase family)
LVTPAPPFDVDRTVVVAGVGPTLGAALARAFADAGERVVVLARSTDRIESLAADLRADGGEAVAVGADVTDPDAVAAAFDAARTAFGSVDALVHNASGGAGGAVADCSPEAFERIWRTRAYGGFLCAREALPDLDAALFAGTSYGLDGSRLAGWSSAAFATRGLARSLAETGVDAAYVGIGAALAPPDARTSAGRLDAAAVAREFVRLADADDPPAEVRIEADSGGEPTVAPPAVEP